MHNFIIGKVPRTSFRHYVPVGTVPHWRQPEASLTFTALNMNPLEWNGNWALAQAAMQKQKRRPSVKRARAKKPVSS